MYLVINPKRGTIGVRAQNKVEARMKWLRVFKLTVLPPGTQVIRGMTTGPVIA
jgi:hypothetical protein